MMQHPNGKGVIENRLQRQFVNVCLDDVSVRQVFGISIGGFDSNAQVYANDGFCPPFANQPRMAAFATAAFDNGFASHKTWRHGRNPIQKLFFMVIGDVIELQPLLSEVFSSFPLNFIPNKVGKPWNAFAYGKAFPALHARQSSADNFRAFAFSGFEQQITGTGRTSQIWKQAFFHWVFIKCCLPLGF